MLVEVILQSPGFCSVGLGLPAGTCGHFISYIVFPTRLVNSLIWSAFYLEIGRKNQEF